MRRTTLFLSITLGILLWTTPAAQSQLPPPIPQGQILEDVTQTKHNLSANPPDEILSSGTEGAQRQVFSPETTEVCVFCHTPHGASSQATSDIGAPIWNRSLSQANYQLYDQVWSRSFEGKLNSNQPTGYSRLCLSCHDGTIALGSVQNAPGSGGFNPDPSNPALDINYAQGVTAPFPFGSIPEGSGTLTGNTRRLGTDLRNDHAISFTYDNNLASVDKELVYPGDPPPKVGEEPLYPQGIGPMRRYPGLNSTIDSVQCTSCHNPHQVNYPKFLRANWFHNESDHPGEQILCLFCHDKPGWIESTHAVSSVKRSKYPIVNNDPNDPASGYDFDGDHTVGEYACRSCHDPHTAQGAKRLHREGVDTPGGNDAIENTCYLCHAPNDQAISLPTLFAPAGDTTNAGNPRFISGTGRPAPDIYTQFAKDFALGGPGSAMNLRLAQGHEPVFTSYPREGVEVNSSFSPPFNKFAPGSGASGSPPASDISPDPRHVECVDCHNPHQVERENRLKGMRGMTFNGLVVGHDSPETGCAPGPCNREPYVYEVCFRCHGNSVSRLFQGDRFPEDDVFRSNPRVLATNLSLSMKGFSNKRLEFATYGNRSQEISATADPQRGSYVLGEPWGTPEGSSVRRVGPGVHKAFHPVVAPGRNATPALCKQLSQAFGLNCPDAGTSNVDVTATALTQLTIQCTDCHNNDFYNAYRQAGGTTLNTDLLGALTESNLRSTDDQSHKATTMAVDYNTDRPREPIGPHGSRHIRILRAPYNTDIANPLRDFSSNGFNQPPGPNAPSANHFNNFLLCFQCHDRRAFDPNTGNNPNDPSWTNFFGFPPSPTDDPGISHQTKGLAQLSWESNLHMYHLQRTGAYCHECHYNIHSNVQATNTIYGDGTGFVVPDSGTCNPGLQNCIGLPPDGEDGIMDGISNTHLINFAPPGGGSSYSGERDCDAAPPPGGLADPACPNWNFPGFDPNPNSVSSHFDIFEGVEGVTADKPVWYYDATVAPPRFRCNLRCHGVVMSTCFYITDRNATDIAMNSGTGWCAGGEAQEAPITFGALPPDVKDLLAEPPTKAPEVKELPSTLKAYMALLGQREVQRSGE